MAGWPVKPWLSAEGPLRARAEPIPPVPPVTRTVCRSAMSYPSVRFVNVSRDLKTGWP